MLGCRSGILGSIKSTLDFRLKLDQYPFQEYEDSFPITNSNDTPEDVDLLLFNKKTARFRVAQQQYLSFKPFQASGDFHITFWLNIPDKKNNMFLFAIGKNSTQMSVHIQASSANVFLYIAGSYILCSQNLAINSWYYFVITRSNGVITVYYTNTAGTIPLRLTVINNLSINSDNQPITVGRGNQIANGNEMFYTDANLADFTFKQGAYTGPLTLPTQRI